MCRGPRRSQIPPAAAGGRRPAGDTETETAACCMWLPVVSSRVHNQFQFTNPVSTVWVMIEHV
jgi:hypothetical protein